MKFAYFDVQCPYELGDKLKGTDGQAHTITDIVVLYSTKTMTTQFVYELDNNGKWVGLRPKEGGAKQGI